MAPLTALIWRELVGYEPLVICCGPWQSERRSCIALEALQYWKIEHSFVPEIPPYEISTVAQNCRQHAAALDLPEEDWLMTSDADLWPVTRDWYHRHESGDHVAAFYYANAYSTKDQKGCYTHHCTCHTVMRVKTWRAVMGITAGCDLANLLKETLDGWLLPRMKGKTPSEAGWQAWNSDEWRTSERIKAQGWYPSGCLFIEREGAPPKSRIDRSAWPAHPSIAGKCDAHLPKAPDQPIVWDTMRELLSQLIPQHMGWIEEYQNRYVRSYIP